LVTTKEIQEKKNFKEGKVSVSYKARELEGRRLEGVTIGNK
jgi:hypothetical protein